MSLPSPGPEHQGPPYSEAELVQRMESLTTGLEEIAERYSEHIALGWEDPEVVGAGHFVFTPWNSHMYRFAIEERYADTDWEDSDRVPTFWTWVSELRVRGISGDLPWMAISGGEVASGDYAELLQEAEIWAKGTSALLAREQALDPDEITFRGREAEGPGRTLQT